MNRLALLLVVCAAPLSVRAADAPSLREIQVSGDAEIKVVPDQAILTLAVETNDKDLPVAKSQNDARVKRVLELATHRFGIDPKHVQTDQVSVEPRYKELQNGERILLGYWVRKSIVICLKDLTRFEDLLSAVLEAGTNYVPGIEFQSSELRKYRDQARAQAMRAAREKATAMAGEVGQKLGRPISITEGAANVFGWRAGNYQNSAPASSAENTSDNAFAPGQLSVGASVSVRFELE